MNSATRVIIIGAGPAGLMAADVLSAAGIAVEIVDAMPSPARKFLRAGVGGLNLTHAEPAALFRQRYNARATEVGRWLDAFDADAVREWARGLGIDTFIGSSGRVFPTRMKAAPLLRAWLQRLNGQGVRWQMRQRWRGWDDAGALVFDSQSGARKVSPGETAAVLLALGGGSWSRLGSDGAWLPLLAARGVDCSPFQPSNGGFTVAWSEHIVRHHAGAPVKNLRGWISLPDGNRVERHGECVVTRHGVEGGLVYALSAHLRAAIARDGSAQLFLDLLPDTPEEKLRAQLSTPRGRDSLANHLRRRVGIAGIKAALLYETAPKAELQEMAPLAALLKALPLTLTGTRPIDEAISTAGGVSASALTDGLMLRELPGVFCAGEMIDWDAPTGGYLLTASLASGVVAANGIMKFLATPR